MVMLHVLVLEDSEDDAALMVRMLGEGGFGTSATRVEDVAAFSAALRQGPCDLILADYHLPGFNALHALQVLRQSGLDIPFIVVTGTLGDEEAVECIKKGADDYLIKDRLARLPAAVAEALDRKRLRIETRQAEETLKETCQRLEQRTKELTALNELFQRHLKERFEVIETARRLLHQLEAGGMDIGSVMEQLRRTLPTGLAEIPR